MSAKIMIEANLLSRLERLPINRKLISIVAVLAFCWVLEAFDLGIIGQVLLVLKQIWTLDPSVIGILGICSTVGVVIGTLSSGFLADRFGRRKVLIAGVTVFTFFTLVGAIYTNIAWIIIMRFLGGLGAGCVFPLPYLMLTEISPGRYRGILVSCCTAILTLAYFLPTFCGSWAIRSFDLEIAWRVPFVVGGLPIVFVLVIYKLIPESPRWLMKKGRHGEVRKLVEEFEKSASVEHDDNYVDPQIVEQLNRTQAQQEATGKQNWKAVVTPPLLRRSVVSWLMNTAGMILWYMCMVYVPTILSTYGFEISLAVLMTGYMMIIGCVGSLVVGPLTDKFGRKSILTIFGGITAICLYLLGSGKLSQDMVLFIGALVAFFGIGVLPVCKVYIAEQYPTELRGVGTGFGETATRIFSGILATYYFAFFMSLGGVSAIFTFAGSVFVVAIVLIWIWGKETARKSVEEVSASN